MARVSTRNRNQSGGVTVDCPTLAIEELGLSAKAENIIASFRRSLSRSYWGGRDLVQIEVGVFDGQCDPPEDCPEAVFRVQLLGVGMIERAIAGVAELARCLDPTAQNLVVDDEVVAVDGEAGVDGQEDADAGEETDAEASDAEDDGDTDENRDDGYGGYPVSLVLCAYGDSKIPGGQACVDLMLSDDLLVELRRELAALAARFASRAAADVQGWADARFRKAAGA